MLDAQMHYPVFTYGARSTGNHSAPVTRRGMRRIFRLGENRSTRREMRSR